MLLKYLRQQENRFVFLLHKYFTVTKSKWLEMRKKNTLIRTCKKKQIKSKTRKSKFVNATLNISNDILEYLLQKKTKKKGKQCKKEMPNFFCLKCLGLGAYRRNADLFQSGIGLVSLGCFARACNGSFCQLDRQGKNGWFHVLLRSQTNILNDDSFFRQLNIVLERGAMKPFSRSSL
jgi:hypothetical protein